MDFSEVKSELILLIQINFFIFFIFLFHISETRSPTHNPFFIFLNVFPVYAINSPAYEISYPIKLIYHSNLAEETSEFCLLASGFFLCRYSQKIFSKYY